LLKLLSYRGFGTYYNNLKDVYYPGQDLSEKEQKELKIEKII